MNQCPKCKRSFTESGFCPFDGIALTKATAASPPKARQVIHVSQGIDTDDLVTHMGSRQGIYEGSAAEHVLNGVLEKHRTQKLIGTELDGRYRIEKIIGEGGMGVVFLAYHMVIDKPVAIKILRPEVADNQNVVKRFVQEARAATKIGHPNIVDVTDFGTTSDGLTYQVMEFLKGQSLAALLRTYKPLPIQRSLSIIRQVARALGAAHSKGIVHRDMKPENIFLITREGREDFVKIVDFGIAKILPTKSTKQGPRLTRAGTVFGTPEYMAPEQASGCSDVDFGVDIYALGIILYEMICGQVPHRGSSTVRTLAMQMLDVPLPLRSVRPDLCINEDLEKVVMHALAKKREHRQQSMAELLQELQNASSQANVDLPTHTKKQPIRLQAIHDFDTIPETDLYAVEPHHQSTPSEMPHSPSPRTSHRATQDPAFTRDKRPSSMPVHYKGDTEDDIDLGGKSKRKRLAMIILFALVVFAILIIVQRKEEPTPGSTHLDFPQTTAKNIPIVEDAAPPLVTNHAPTIFDARVDSNSTDNTDRTLKEKKADAKQKERTRSNRRKRHLSNKSTTLAKGNFELTVYSRPSGARLYIGQTYAGTDGLNIRRRIGEKLKMSCQLEGWSPGQIQVIFDGKTDIYVCRLSKERVKKCVKGTKNPFDKCD